MPIPESQLETWSHQGAVQNSTNAYNSVKNCIAGFNWKSDINFDSYLQGSYGNATNIYGNSDVDIVVEFKNLFYYDISRLPSDQRLLFEQELGEPVYTLADFKTNVLKALQGNYTGVVEGSKAIKVPETGGRVSCDVVCCGSYREYKSYSYYNKTDFQSGIRFFDKHGNAITNFPDQHYKNGVTKNQETSNYKATVRIFKKIRDKLIQLKGITDSEVPSYYLECLIYNVPNGHFQQYSYQGILESAINFLNSASLGTGMDDFVCQNWMRYLFKGGFWDINSAKKFIKQAKGLWDGW